MQNLNVHKFTEYTWNAKKDKSGRKNIDNLSANLTNQLENEYTNSNRETGQIKGGDHREHPRIIAILRFQRDTVRCTSCWRTQI